MARYPDIEAAATGWLDVGDGHELYWEEAGDPDGAGHSSGDAGMGEAVVAALDGFAAS